VSCVQPEDLLAHVDGVASSGVVNHVKGCSHCASQVQAYAAAQHGFTRTFFRFKCPDPEELGEYELGLTSAEQRVAIASHVVECPRCSEDLRTLREYLAAPTEPDPEAGVLDRLRRLVATATSPAPGAAYAGLRASGGAGTRTYRAGGVTVSLSSTPPDHQGRASLDGLILHDNAPASDLGGIEVVLQAPNQVTHVAAIDDLGSFTFESVLPGTYHLEVRLPHEVVVIEALSLPA
jgi:hypothetical protein